MDKETLSNYGWIVICTLVLAVMIALATPFGEYIKDGVWSTTNGLNDTLNKNMEIAGLSGSGSGDNSEPNTPSTPSTPLHFGEKYYVTACSNTDMIMTVYYIFYEDGSATVYNGEETSTLPSGSFEYTETEAKPTNGDTPATIIENGTKFTADGITATLESALPNGFAVTTYGQFLTWDEIKNKYNVTDTAINEQAFYENENIAYISLPDTITSIDDSAFGYCSSLKTIAIPDGVTYIGDLAFFQCTSLKNITIPDSVTTIGSSAFGYFNIENITIPSGVTSVGSGLFQSSKVKNVTILGNLTTISRGMFIFCSSLESVTLPNTITTIDSQGFAYLNLETITLPASVTYIENWAFYGYGGEIVYEGTIEQWNAITKISGWDDKVDIQRIVCTDGTIPGWNTRY